MKKIMAIAMVAMVAGITSADLSIDWTSGIAGGVYDDNGVDFVEGGTAQLIWSTSPMIDTAGAYDVANMADEFVLLTDVTGAYGQGFAGSGIWSNADVGGNEISSGYFYTRIFSATSDSFLDIAGGSPVLATYSATDPSTVYSDAVLAGVYTINQNGTTVIPEPATIGLMGIAGLGMFLARRKSRR